MVNARLSFDIPIIINSLWVTEPQVGELMNYAKQMPGAVSRSGTIRQFQFLESTDLHCRVKCRAAASAKRSAVHSLKVVDAIGAVVAAGTRGSRL